MHMEEEVNENSLFLCLPARPFLVLDTSMKNTEGGVAVS